MIKINANTEWSVMKCGNVRQEATQPWNIIQQNNEKQENNGMIYEKCLAGSLNTTCAAIMWSLDTWKKGFWV